jgi:hypothetical protein
MKPHKSWDDAWQLYKQTNEFKNGTPFGFYVWVQKKYSLTPLIKPAPGSPEAMEEAVNTLNIDL